MNKYKNIIFWIPYVCAHITEFIGEVAKASPGVTVLCFANEGLLLSRKNLGWEEDSIFPFDCYVEPTAEFINQTVKGCKGESIHVFYGFRWMHVLIEGLKCVKSAGDPFIIVQEPRVREGLSGELRFLHSWLTESWHRQKCLGVLGIGRHGPSWFKSVGYPPSKVFPFAYFVDPSNNVCIPEKLKSLSIGYVGRLIKMKGVDDLIVATHQLGIEARLTIVGSGEETQPLTRLCKDMGVNAEFLGVIPKNEISGLIASFDLLILPSRSMDDGWGVVVSEALMEGTAVIASSCVGASIVLDNPLAGIMVNPNSPSNIAAAISQLRSREAFSSSMRLQRKDWARAHLSAESGSQYFLRILDHLISGGPRPDSFL
ncbi:glycosyltransferase [Methylomicrobium lacus]|uniref:glycosyltransferase n=1 Tax=Methylomicrobium lacus TaxID=136992 RepID=UPI0004BB4710|nr:glycosyltransferase [Methylomicrobium lacus]